jgi:20S proteasome alpha/beta subunit
MAVDKKTLKCNKPRKTPSHNTKSHIVKACENGKERIIRFGQQGVTTAGKKTDAKSKARRASFKARHAKNIKKGKMSAAYWADKVKW